MASNHPNIYPMFPTSSTSDLFQSQESCTEIIRDARADWQDTLDSIAEGQRCELVHDLAFASEPHSVPLYGMAIFYHNVFLDMSASPEIVSFLHGLMFFFPGVLV